MYSRFPVQYAELLCLLLPMHTHSIGNIINEDGLVRLSMDGKGKVVAVLDASLFQDQVTKICTHRFKMEQGRLVALHPGK